MAEVEEERVTPVDTAPEAAGGQVFRRTGTEVAAKARLDRAENRAQHRVDTLKKEADAKAESLRMQHRQAKGDVKARIEDRMRRDRSAYPARGAKLSHA